MADAPYVKALSEAEFLITAPLIKGIPVWRGQGLVAVDLLVRSFASLVARRRAAPVVQHGFLASAHQNRQVFGEYDNVYELEDVAGETGLQMRSDNIVPNLGLLTKESSAGPIIAVGAVVRDAPGKTPPLFRDKHIWPVVELNELAPAEEADATLDFYREVMSDLLRLLGIPSITVETPALAEYGKKTYLTVAALPNRRPTVLATLYQLADRLRLALHETRQIIDVGFTGKVFATAAIIHRDHRGLVLASAVAPVQLGVIVSGSRPSPETRGWLTRLSAAGIRTEVKAVAEKNFSGRARAERRWLRRGVPLILGLDRTPGRIVLCSRTPLHRKDLRGLPGPAAVSALLAAHDARMYEAAKRVFDDTMSVNAHLKPLCENCVEGFPSFGVIVPKASVPCDVCGADGLQHFISEEGRFY